MRQKTSEGTEHSEQGNEGQNHSSRANPLPASRGRKKGGLAETTIAGREDVAAKRGRLSAGGSNPKKKSAE